MRPRLALVPGEPAGIGPELVVRALQHDWDADLTVFGDGAVLAAAAHALGLSLPAELALVEIPSAVASVPGQLDVRNAPMVVDALCRAAQGCLDGDFDGLVTGPVHKGVINDAGIPFTGTTGLLAEQAGREVVMMLANPGMRVALQTVHLPLRAVADAITPAALSTTLRIVETALRTQFGIDQPVIAVLGLNPHAGEDGHLGREEQDVIAPTLARLRDQGLNLVGPLPADTAFLPTKLAGFDAVLAMYHDQGLPVLKHSDFANAVNISLGLPYPRVAVDHGTALDLAGTGMADPSSLFAAIRTCARMAGRGAAG
jgi:4-hydroxythreonine-4-phosphate dehydrogenase